MGDHALETISPERAALAPFVPVRRKHEMLHDKLTAAVKQISQALLAAWPVEHVGLFDLDPWQRAPLGAEPITRPREFSFMIQMRFAGCDPFLTRDNLVRLHRDLLCGVSGEILLQIVEHPGPSALVIVARGLVDELFVLEREQRALAFALQRYRDQRFALRS